MGHAISVAQGIAKTSKKKIKLLIIYSKKLNPTLLKLTNSPKLPPLTKLPLQSKIRYKLKQ